MNAKRCRAESRQRISKREVQSWGYRESELQDGKLKLLHRWLLILNSVSAGELKVAVPQGDADSYKAEQLCELPA